jgi:hypothetical protein
LVATAASGCGDSRPSLLLWRRLQESDKSSVSRASRKTLEPVSRVPPRRSVERDCRPSTRARWPLRVKEAMAVTFVALTNTSRRSSWRHLSDTTSQPRRRGGGRGPRHKRCRREQPAQGVALSRGALVMVRGQSGGLALFFPSAGLGAPRATPRCRVCIPDQDRGVQVSGGEPWPGLRFAKPSRRRPSRRRCPPSR